MGPLPYSRTPWLINGGDPSYLRPADDPLSISYVPVSMEVIVTTLSKLVDFTYLRGLRIQPTFIGVK